MKIQIRPIEKSSWHGKKGVESFTRPKVVRALVDVETLTYKTGLDYENRIFEDPKDKSNKLTEAEYYGKLLKVDLSNNFHTEEAHPFWDSRMSAFKLENRTMILDTKNPMDYVKWKMLKQSKFVANSIAEYEKGYYPEATHVIFDEQEDIEIKATRIAIKKQAYSKVEKLSKGQKIELIMILSADGDYIKAKNLKGMSDNFVEVELDKIVDNKPSLVLEYLKNDKATNTTKALVLESLQKNVLRKEGHKIMYHESVIGEDLDSAVHYLNKPENQELKIRLQSQI